jgi:hypothetical protein
VNLAISPRSQTAIEAAIENVESVRAKVVNPEYRLSYFAGSQDYYEFYVDLLMRLHKEISTTVRTPRHFKRVNGHALGHCSTRLRRRTQTYVKAWIRPCSSASVRLKVA